MTKEEIEKYLIKKNKWVEEDHRDLKTLQGKILHLSRIKFVPVQPELSKEPIKRCLSLTKNGRSVAFDIEMVKAVTAYLEELGADFAPDN